MTISAETLRQGAWFSLEQAGRLINSSVILLNSGDSSSSILLAMYCREEMGKSKLLEQLADKVDSGETISSLALDDHEKKLQAAIQAVPFGCRNDSQLGLILKNLELDENYEKFNDSIKTKKKRLPSDRHKLRCKNLYVDLNSNQSSWSCPKETTLNAAREEVLSAVNDYAIHLQPYFSDRASKLFPKMMAVYESLKDEIEIKKPIWPNSSV